LFRRFCLDFPRVVRCQHRAKARAALTKDVRAAVGALHFEPRAFWSDGDDVHGRGGDSALLQGATLPEAVLHAAVVRIQAGVRGCAVRRKVEVRRQAQRGLAMSASWAATVARRRARAFGAPHRGLGRLVVDAHFGLRAAGRYLAMPPPQRPVDGAIPLFHEAIPKALTSMAHMHAAEAEHAELKKKHHHHHHHHHRRPSTRPASHDRQSDAQKD